MKKYIFSLFLFFSLFAMPLLAGPDIFWIHKNTSWKEIKKYFGSEYKLVYDPNYRVDSGAMVVKSGDEILFAILTHQVPVNKTTFLTLVISSPSIKTPEGIGVCSLISDAVKVYGSVELSYNPENESREFAVFERGPQNILFRTGSADEAGIYAPGAYHTKNYKKDAKIRWMIMTLK